MEVNVRNIKLITETRICHILLETKFIPLCRKILESETHAEQIKVCLINGYTNAIRNHKNRVAVIKNIVPVLSQVMKIHGRDFNPNPEIKEDPLVEAIILLLVRLGGIVNRKIFIPG